MFNLLYTDWLTAKLKVGYLNELQILFDYLAILAHEYAVRGIVCDEISSILISGDHNGVVNFWAFKTGILLKSLKLDASIDKFYLKKET